MPEIANTDSEATSLAPSSPARSLYYVQSPTYDGEKTTTSFYSTPAGSPPHSSFGRHSHESSSTGFSGSLKPGSRKISPNDITLSGRRQQQNHRKGQKPWNKINVIEEEGHLDDEESQKGIPRRCYVLAFVVGFFILFSLFALILWAASKPQKPTMAMKSITFERLVIQAGSDFTGVATDMVTLNATVRMTFRNTATFFGVHVTSAPLDLSYSQITVGSGTIKKFYQKRKSERLVSIPMMGEKIPLYGSGVGLSTSKGTTTKPVHLKLILVVKSKAFVLGKLVKPNFNKKIECTVVFDPKRINAPISLTNSCKYD